MASTISDATLTVTITEKVVLNGRDQGATNVLSINNINEISKRIVTVTTTETGLLGFATTSATDLSKSYLAGLFDEDDVRYIRITNLDDSNHAGLIFRNEDGDEFGVKLDFGQSFIYSPDREGGVVDTMDAAATAITANTFADLVDITATADTASVDLEIFVAST